MVRAKLEYYPIPIEDLKSFIETSSGTVLTQTEIENCLHFIETDNYFFDSERVSSLQIYEMIISNTFFSNYHPQIFFYYVFDNYLREMKSIESPFISFNQQESPFFMHQRSIEFSTPSLLKFFEFYKTYFTEEQTKFIERECGLLGPQFSLDSFIFTLVSLRQFKPY
jgi:hypothetical protein